MQYHPASDSSLLSTILPNSHHPHHSHPVHTTVIGLDFCKVSQLPPSSSFQCVPKAAAGELLLNASHIMSLPHSGLTSDFPPCNVWTPESFQWTRSLTPPGPLWHPQLYFLLSSPLFRMFRPHWPLQMLSYLRSFNLEYSSLGQEWILPFLPSGLYSKPPYLWSFFWRPRETFISYPHLNISFLIVSWNCMISNRCSLLIYCVFGCSLPLNMSSTARACGLWCSLTYCLIHSAWYVVGPPQTFTEWMCEWKAPSTWGPERKYVHSKWNKCWIKSPFVTLWVPVQASPPYLIAPREWITSKSPESSARPMVQTQVLTTLVPWKPARAHLGLVRSGEPPLELAEPYPRKPGALSLGTVQE